MSPHLKRLQKIVSTFPPGEEKNWWDRYFWYRLNSDRTTALTIVSAVVCILLSTFSAPKVAINAAFSLTVAGGVVSVSLNIIRSFVWAKKFRNLKHDD